MHPAKQEIVTFEELADSEREMIVRVSLLIGDCCKMH